MSQVPTGSLLLVYVMKDPGGRRYLQAFLNTAPLRQLKLDELTPGVTAWMCLESFVQGTAVPPSSRWRRSVWSLDTPRELEPVRNIPTIGSVAAQRRSSTPTTQPAAREIRGKDIGRGELLMAYVERKSDRHLELVVWPNEPPYTPLDLDRLPAGTMAWQCTETIREGGRPAKYATWRQVNWAPNTRRVYPPFAPPSTAAKVFTAALDLVDRLASSPVTQTRSHTSEPTPPPNRAVNGQPAVFPGPAPQPSWHTEKVRARELRHGDEIYFEAQGWQHIAQVSLNGPATHVIIRSNLGKLHVPVDQVYTRRRWY